MRNEGWGEVKVMMLISTVVGGLFLYVIFETEGKPLWSGDRKDLFVRGAFEDEISKWEKTFAQARLDGDATDEDRDSYIVFLVPITDPTEDED